MVETNKIYNMDCKELMNQMGEDTVDVILTSPFYNTSKKAGKKGTLENSNANPKYYHYLRYDVHVDSMTDEEYSEYTVDLFNKFDRVLSDNGVILYNMSYGADGASDMLKVINDISTYTDFTVADMIVWKKPTAMPNNVSHNKLTRIIEYIFVICRKDEFKTFNSNKKVTSVRKTGQKAYENITNYIEAKNNDGSCPYNKATYSTDLCKQLLNIYAPDDSLVFDPFIGSGTTANACVELGLDYIGTEISDNQFKWAKNRIENTKKSMKIE